MSRIIEISNTLTIIKSTNGNIFGGYTEKARDSSGNVYADPKAFIFSLINKENKPFIVIDTNDPCTIYCDSSLGSLFGGGFDIHIASDSNSNQDSSSNFGYSYKHPDYQYETEEA